MNRSESRLVDLVQAPEQRAVRWRRASAVSVVGSRPRRQPGSRSTGPSLPLCWASDTPAVHSACSTARLRRTAVVNPSPRPPRLVTIRPRAMRRAELRRQPGRPLRRCDRAVRRLCRCWSTRQSTPSVLRSLLGGPPPGRSSRCCALRSLLRLRSRFRLASALLPRQQSSACQVRPLPLSRPSHAALTSPSRPLPSQLDCALVDTAGRNSPSSSSRRHEGRSRLLHHFGTRCVLVFVLVVHERAPD